MNKIQKMLQEARGVDPMLVEYLNDALVDLEDAIRAAERGQEDAALEAVNSSLHNLSKTKGRWGAASTAQQTRFKSYLR